MHTITTFPPYPWLQDVWVQLQAVRSSGQLPHAILFSGAEGLGKFELAQALAWSLLCKSPSESGQPCGQCSGCNLMAAGNHPDLTVIEPEDTGKAIKIDTIREFIGREAITAHAGGYKPVLIRPADAMNQAAANSLLKTLEEPVSGTIMILISANPSRLPATIRSRCRQIAIPVPAAGTACEWLQPLTPESDPEVLLQTAAGSPLNALRMSDPESMELRQRLLSEFCDLLTLKLDPIVVAGRWLKQDLREILHWMCGWVIDMLRLQVVPQPAIMINPDQRERLLDLVRIIDTKRLFQALDHIYEARGNIDATLNDQMTLERLLLALVKSRR
ncbi:MAG: DNA polymerase III subunit delta' [Gammaproteobacteria bacterium]|nr:DNA polymerase III subunit delta' [Gammaproteobacteria bacterium]